MKHLLSFVVFLAISLFSCRNYTERLEHFSVHGIDVSHYQSDIDWERVAQQGIDFGFVKATEGTDFRDTLFCNNWEGMQQQQIIRGAYHFFRPSVSAIEQASHFIETVDLAYGDLPPVVDIEVKDGVSEQLIIAGLKVWLGMVEQAYGIRPIIYTNMKFYNWNLAGHFDDYPIWIARYNELAPQLCAQKEWHFWQYGNRGKIKGINGAVDLNVFQGSRSELLSLTYSPYSSPATAWY